MSSSSGEGKTPNGGREKLVAQAKASPGNFMRRHGKLFDQIINLDNLRLAFVRARRGKSWQIAVKRTERGLEERLLRLRESLLDRTFHTSPYKMRTIYVPKKRLIYRLPFYPDRIVQHALMNVVEPIWDAMFIADSYACRRGKGVHAGSRRTMEYVRRHRYCLKGDISQFYPSMDHDILFGLVQRKLKCPGTLWLLRDIIYSVPGGKNVPIGNYTSQWLGNLYLHELDRFVKHTLKIKAYLRYCDDFCFFHDDKQLLGECLASITAFLRDRLALTLSKKDLFPVTQGVDFLGYRHFRDYILLRKSTAKRVKARLKLLPGALAKGRITREQMRSSLASTLGWLRHANAHNFRQNLKIDKLYGGHQTV